MLKRGKDNLLGNIGKIGTPSTGKPELVSLLGLFSREDDLQSVLMLLIRLVAPPRPPLGDLRTPKRTQTISYMASCLGCSVADLEGG